MKKYAVFIGIIIFLGMTVGCSEKQEQFDGKNINFEVESNTIEITNETGFSLENISLKISDPFDTVKSNNNNNTERETIIFIEELKFESNETKEISIPFTLKGSMELDFKGNRVKGNNKVPFHIVGSLMALVSNPNQIEIKY
ncbi:hypothetical protein NC661_04620 [Aquibacillus koreensis]|uniref:Lipoprotein n=1 Tax=Aquibacillus koreensis TaxID=279446 RepID=A0A9X4AIS7_9BACI|nr:hypothetical protein [Aquibacillus koreensis]MCT2534742.1 hypothetical protein [Aquibacillus koreensis]MDC3419648.1 hypothetical protein [Aquibacillus koreensis]